MAALLLEAGWAAAWQRQMPADAITSYVGDESQLIQVRGVLADAPRPGKTSYGAMAKFAGWQPSRTYVTLQVRELWLATGWQRASGRLRVVIPQADAALRPGEAVEMTGWLGSRPSRLNPGAKDMLAALQRQGLDGWLYLASSANVHPWPQTGASWSIWPAWSGVLQFRGDSQAAAERALLLGLVHDDPSTALLEALLLGRRGPELDLVQESFRRTGLVHLLSISGAHLAILLVLVGAAARWFCKSPRGMAAWVIPIMGVYLWVLPPEVPIVRTAIMAGCVGAGWMSGRRVLGLEMVALAAVLVLLWRPGEIASPGAQLSFGLTAGLLAFTAPLARRWEQALLVRWPALEARTPPPDDPMDEDAHDGSARGGVAEEAPWVPLLEPRLPRWGRWLVGAAAVNVVGWTLALPLVAFHFGMVSPVALGMSVAAEPVTAGVLGLGFAKLWLGALWPSAGLALAGPTAALARVMLWLTQTGAAVPGGAWELRQPVSTTWCVATLVVVALWLSGRLTARPRRTLAAAALLLGWLIVSQCPTLTQAWGGAPPLGVVDGAQAALRLDVLAVGNGNCILGRAASTDVTGWWRARPAQTFLFDCGSGERLDVGISVVAPALRQLGVECIDEIFLSHVDMDHLCGTLDVADRFPVGRVWVTPQFLAAAQANSQGPAGFVITGLRERGIPVDTLARGWERTTGPVHWQLLWPPGEQQFTRTNDTSMVLALAAGGRRVFLNGDIQNVAMAGLLAPEENHNSIESSGPKGHGVDQKNDTPRYNLHADVTDLPHHGSFVTQSPAWLAAVGPRLTLQSSGPARLHPDKWAQLLPLDGPVPRLVTARDGMIEVALFATTGAGSHSPAVPWLRWCTYTSQRHGVLNN